MSCYHLILFFLEPINQSQFFTQSVKSGTQIVNNLANTYWLFWVLLNETIKENIYVSIVKGILPFEGN